MANSWLRSVDLLQSNGIRHLFPKFEKYIVRENQDSIMTLRFKFDNGFECWIYCVDNSAIPELWHVRIYKNGKICEITPDSLGKENFASIKDGCNRNAQITAFSKESVESIISAIKNFIA